MSRDRTFYLNRASLQEKQTEIENDYYTDRERDNAALSSLKLLLDEPADLVFKKMSIVMKWWEYSNECEKFRNLLNKYKIEFQETE